MVAQGRLAMKVGGEEAGEVEYRRQKGVGSMVGILAWAKEHRGMRRAAMSSVGNGGGTRARKQQQRERESAREGESK